MTVLGSPTRKLGIRRIFLAYASGYQIFKQHQFVLAALVASALENGTSVIRSIETISGH